jgi:NADPH:quinone reductase-like Zn-dependent oxidoreductase
MAPQTQKALLVTEVGKPLTLVTDWPVPQPGPNQVQIRVTVAGPNPHDQKARDRGLFIAEHLPAVLSNDVVGQIVAVGSDVTDFSIGEKVFGQAGISPGSAQNGFQEYAVLDTDFIAKIPDGFTEDDVASLPTNILAPVIAFFSPSLLGLPAPWYSAAPVSGQKDKTILILGGGSNCGKFGVQLAALAEFGRIVVVGGSETELKSYGATHVIDRHGTPSETVARIREVVGDDLLYAYDAINPLATQVIGINALSSTKKGKMARLLPIGPIDESQVQKKKAGYELLDVLGLSHLHAELSKSFWEHLPRFLREGKIKPSAYKKVDGWGAEEVNKVLDAYRDGKKVAKTHFHL